jgi:hypothetical protein
MKIIIAALVLLFIALVLTRTTEGFFGATSPGTMVQLRTSHVPTEEDAYYFKYIYPQVVNRDLIRMTGSGLY